MSALGFVASLADAWIETFDCCGSCEEAIVASLADAWIETTEMDPGWAVEIVASLADAWIETGVETGSRARHASRPSRTRGLKQLNAPGVCQSQVASLADAWIETLYCPDT